MDIESAESIANVFRLLHRLKVLDRSSMIDAIDLLQIRVFEEYQKKVSDGIDRDLQVP